jgi:hypothetical protein
MPERGRTPLMSNDGSQFLIDRGLDETIILDSDKMLSSKIYGETMINLLSERANEIFTFYTGESNVEMQSNINLAVDPAEISTGEVRGYTFENKVPMYGQS